MDDGIYETVPEKAIEQGYEDKRHLIKDFLSVNKGKWFTAKQIAEAVGFPARGTQVEVRKAITLLLERDSIPIVSTEAGYTFAVQSNQLFRYSERLIERKVGLDRRITKVQDLAHEMAARETV